MIRTNYKREKMKYKIYTKTGDDGTSGLVGGNRVKKSDLRLEAYGTVDELNSWIGLIRSAISDHEVSDLLMDIQNNLFIIGSKLASDEQGKRITDSLVIETDKIENLEKAIDKYEVHLPVIHNFILPGGSVLSGYCHIARTVCRRAERCIIRMDEDPTMDQRIVQYVNRLSDYLFVLARKIANDTGVEEIFWSK
jgi:cob(I)alamin adenosyltransferase